MLYFSKVLNIAFFIFSFTLQYTLNSFSSKDSMRQKHLIFVYSTCYKGYNKVKKIYIIVISIIKTQYYVFPFDFEFKRDSKQFPKFYVRFCS